MGKYALLQDTRRQPEWDSNPRISFVETGKNAEYSSWDARKSSPHRELSHILQYKPKQNLIEKKLKKKK